MSPLGQILPNVRPEYQSQPQFPYQDGGGVGEGMTGGDVGPVPWHSDAVTPESYLGSNALPGASTAIYQMKNGRYCCRLLSPGGAGTPLVGSNFPAWLPAWSSDLAAGTPPTAWNAVAIFDLFFSFSDPASSYAADSTGLFFLAAQPADNVAASTLPLGGGQNRGSFAFVAADDGGGGQGIEYAAWGSGVGPARVDTVVPTQTFDPEAWNHGRVQIVGASPTTNATLSVWLNGEQLKDGEVFDGPNLVSPLNLSGAGSRPSFSLGCTVEGGSAQAFFYRWTARFGLFTADGVQVRV